MSALAALLKARAKASQSPVTQLLPKLDLHLRSKAMSDDRRDEMFHPSDLSRNFCPRAWALYNYHADGYAVKEGSIDPRLARIFGNGHGVHARIQGYFADMGLLWGWWKNGKTRKYGKRPGPAWTYDEISLRHDGDWIKGSTDGLLAMPGKVGLEIKSINENGFKWHTETCKDEHRDQVYIYMHCLTQPDPEAAGLDALPLEGFVVLYENKNNQELKEWFIPYEPAKVAAFMETLRPRMQEGKDYSDRWNKRALELGLEEAKARTQIVVELPTCHCPSGKENDLCKKLGG